MSIRNYPLSFLAFAFIFTAHTELSAQYAALINLSHNPYNQIFFGSQESKFETAELSKTDFIQVEESALKEKPVEVAKATEPTKVVKKQLSKTVETTTESVTITENTTATPTKSVTKKIEKKPKRTAFVRKTKRISAAYESYAVVLKESNRPLLSTDPIFKQFGNVVYDKTEHGSYVYLICTPFKSTKSVESFIEVVLQSRFPDAYLVGYDKGKMKKH